jgi:hypothetical protein
MGGRTNLDLDRPRSIGEMLTAALALYWRVPILFLAFAAIVVVPYELIVLAISGAGPIAQGHLGFFGSKGLLVADSFIVTPLISALHVHAVREVGEGGRPRLIPTFRRSLPALPVVALATGLAWIGATLALVALIVPGVMLWARWAVTAQTAALEGGGWTDALRRSADLTDGHRWHVFGVASVAALIALAPTLALGAAFGHETTTAGSFAADVALQIIVRSFEALTLALLYFDLKSRVPEIAPTPVVPAQQARQADDGRSPGWYIDPSAPTRMRYWAADGKPGWSKRTAKTPKTMLLEWQEHHRTEPAAPAMVTDERTGHSLDPDVYSDEGRPPGWYVDPDRPWLMRYWRTGDNQGWSKETTKTPKKAQSEWRDFRWRR